MRRVRLPPQSMATRTTWRGPAGSGVIDSSAPQMVVASSSSLPARDSSVSVRQVTRCVGTSRQAGRASVPTGSINADGEAPPTPWPGDGGGMGAGPRVVSVTAPQAPAAASLARRAWSAGRGWTPAGTAWRRLDPHTKKVPDAGPGPVARGAWRPCTGAAPSAWIELQASSQPTTIRRWAGRREECAEAKEGTSCPTPVVATIGPRAEQISTDKPRMSSRCGAAGVTNDRPVGSARARATLAQSVASSATHTVRQPSAARAVIWPRSRAAWAGLARRGSSVEPNSTSAAARDWRAVVTATSNASHGAAAKASMTSAGAAAGSGSGRSSAASKAKTMSATARPSNDH